MNSPMSTRCTWLASGSAIVRRWRTNITYRSRQPTSKKRCDFRCCTTWNRTAWSRKRLRTSPHKTLSCRALRLRAIPCGVQMYPQGESNPCLLAENQMSWASRRWGPRPSFSTPRRGLSRSGSRPMRGRARGRIRKCVRVARRRHHPRRVRLGRTPPRIARFRSGRNARSRCRDPASPRRLVRHPK